MRLTQGATLLQGAGRPLPRLLPRRQRLPTRATAQPADRQASRTSNLPTGPLNAAGPVLVSSLLGAVLNCVCGAPFPPRGAVGDNQVGLTGGRVATSGKQSGRRRRRRHPVVETRCGCRGPRLPVPQCCGICRAYSRDPTEWCCPCTHRMPLRHILLFSLSPPAVGGGGPRARGINS